MFFVADFKAENGSSVIALGPRGQSLQVKDCRDNAIDIQRTNNGNNIFLKKNQEIPIDTSQYSSAGWNILSAVARPNNETLFHMNVSDKFFFKK